MVQLAKWYMILHPYEPLFEETALTPIIRSGSCSLIQISHSDQVLCQLLHQEIYINDEWCMQLAK